MLSCKKHRYHSPKGPHHCSLDGSAGASVAVNNTTQFIPTQNSPGATPVITAPPSRVSTTPPHLPRLPPRASWRMPVSHTKKNNQNNNILRSWKRISTWLWSDSLIIGPSDVTQHCVHELITFLPHLCQTRQRVAAFARLPKKSMSGWRESLPLQDRQIHYSSQGGKPKTAYLPTSWKKFSCNATS